MTTNVRAAGGSASAVLVKAVRKSPGVDRFTVYLNQKAPAGGLILDWAVTGLRAPPDSTAPVTAGCPTTGETTDGADETSTGGSAGASEANEPSAETGTGGSTSSTAAKTDDCDDTGQVDHPYLTSTDALCSESANQSAHGCIRPIENPLTGKAHP